MSTRDDLLYEAAALEREADALDAAIAELERVGRDTATFRARVRETRQACERIRAIALQIPASVTTPIPPGLTAANQTGKVSNVTPEGRRAISEFRGDDEFLRAVRAAGYASVREMVHDIRRPGCPDPKPEQLPVVAAAFISTVRAEKRPMPEWLADEIQRLTGFEKSKWWRVVSDG